MTGKPYATVLLTLLLGGAGALPAPASSLGEHPAVADALTLLDLWIEEQMAYAGIPGLSVGIVHDQELVWAQGYGYRDLESQSPATPATLYRLGSVSKLFTATAILQLRDAGKLSLHDAVAAHLPGFQVRNPFAGAPPVNLLHLLTHTAGLPREGAFPYWTTHEFPSREQILAALRDQELLTPPGETYKYSNLGVALLGHVIEAVSGRTYADYLATYVFGPLGMTSSTAAPTAEHHRRRATSYLRRRADGTRASFDYYDMEGMAAAGNVISSVEDLARFASLQFRDGAAGGEQILSGYTLREMHRPHFVYPSFSGALGLLFRVSREEGTTLVSHGGWIGGNRTHLLLAPAAKVAVIAMTNADDASPYRFGRQAFEVVAPALALATAPPTAPTPRADPAWERYLGVYTDPWGWEYEVLVLGEQLVLYDHDYPPAEDPEASLTRLTPVREHTFRMPDGELVVFELDDAGAAVRRIRRRYDYIYPVDR